MEFQKKEGRKFSLIGLGSVLRNDKTFLSTSTWPSSRVLLTPIRQDLKVLFYSLYIFNQLIWPWRGGLLNAFRLHGNFFLIITYGGPFLLCLMLVLAHFYIDKRVLQNLFCQIFFLINYEVIIDQEGGSLLFIYIIDALLHLFLR